MAANGLARAFAGDGTLRLRTHRAAAASSGDGVRRATRPPDVMYQYAAPTVIVNTAAMAASVIRLFVDIGYPLVAAAAAHRRPPAIEPAPPLPGT